MFSPYLNLGLSGQHHGDKHIVKSSRLSELVDLYHGSHHQFPFEKFDADRGFRTMAALRPRRSERPRSPQAGNYS